MSGLAVEDGMAEHQHPGSAGPSGASLSWTGVQQVSGAQKGKQESWLIVDLGVWVGPA